MTFLTTRYRLMRTLTPKELERLRNFSTEYGVLGVSIDGEELLVEYDASRWCEAELLGRVRRLGIDVKREQEIPAGAVDDKREFQDSAWPTSDLSPIHQDRK